MIPSVRNVFSEREGSAVPRWLPILAAVSCLCALAYGVYGTTWSGGGPSSGIPNMSVVFAAVPLVAAPIIARRCGANALQWFAWAFLTESAVAIFGMIVI